MARRIGLPKINIDDILAKVQSGLAEPSTRDAFAGVTMAIILFSGEDYTPEEVADTSYVIADAMMKRRKSGPSE